MTDTQRFDVVVLGGGSGLTAAYHAVRDGKRVALVDSRPDALGGTCVNRGCIPTKGLIQAAEVMKTIREASRFGIHLDQDSVRVDFRRVGDVVRERRAGDAAGTREWVESEMTPFYGEARFVGERTLEVRTEDGPVRVAGETVFIAAGARPVVPPIPGLSEVDFWTNEEAIEATMQPESLLVLGGGYVGAEFAHFFATLGTEVTMVDRSGVLSGEDEDVQRLFREEFGKRVTLLEGYSVAEVRRDGRHVVAVTEDGEGLRQEFEAEKLLVATGRAPNTESLGLEAAGVETDEKGWIRVDERLRTTADGVYAYGDVIGRGMFKHTSSAEGGVAYRNSRGGDEAMDYTADPHAVFTDPQVGGVGLTEQECREQGLDYAVGKADYDSTAKGRIVGAPPGFAKVLVERGSDRILGFWMMGPHAADLVHEVVVAMNAPGAKAELVRRATHIHPTLPELVQSAFQQVA